MNTNEHEGAEDLSDVQPTEGNESTDWKNEHKTLVEKAIRAREKNKALRDSYKALQSELETLKKNSGSPTQEKKGETRSDEFGLLHKSFLRSAGITSDEEVELARTTAKKWGIAYDQIDKLIGDEDFKIKLDKFRTEKSNADAVSNLKGGGGKSEAKNSPEYWIAKGVPPTAEQVGDRKTRATIIRAFMKNAGTNNKTFYND